MKFEDIREVHLEPTQKCNARCPQCARSVFGGATDPDLPLYDLNMDDIQNIFSKKLCSQLDLVLLCGTHGDPIFSEVTLKSVEYLRRNGVKSIWLYTNGSAKSSEWWQELAKLLDSPKDRVCFSIDGLEDTNHLYRIGTKWENIMRSVESYTGAGGKARWEFLVFKHNEHQVEEAQELAKKLGFHDFRIRKTARFKPQFRGNAKSMTPILNKMSEEETKDFVENFKYIPTDRFNTDYIIEPPEKQELKNDAIANKYINIIKKYETFENFVDKAEISCLYRNRFKRIYVNSNAKLWPCSYVGSLEFEWLKSEYYIELREKVINRYGENFNSLRTQTLEEALKHPWFNEDLVCSFENRLDDSKNPRLFKCGRTCGKDFDPIMAQTEHKRLLND